ncbi:hypothetical protein GE09DRAFT_241982 [Coniochaeta sp. 2T2.1]|nr:hypothetical protein GE09DRAFT_241982 [Coniochaeta sp. 2T2.1]
MKRDKTTPDLQVSVTVSVTVSLNCTHSRRWRSQAQENTVSHCAVSTLLVEHYRQVPDGPQTLGGGRQWLPRSDLSDLVPCKLDKLALAPVGFWWGLSWPWWFPFLVLPGSPWSCWQGSCRHLPDHTGPFVCQPFQGNRCTIRCLRNHRTRIQALEPPDPVLQTVSFFLLLFFTPFLPSFSFFSHPLLNLSSSTLALPSLASFVCSISTTSFVFTWRIRYSDRTKHLSCLSACLASRRDRVSAGRNTSDGSFALGNKHNTRDHPGTTSPLTTSTHCYPISRWKFNLTADLTNHPWRVFPSHQFTAKRD